MPISERHERKVNIRGVQKMEVGKGGDEERNGGQTE